MVNFPDGPEVMVVILMVMMMVMMAMVVLEEDFDDADGVGDYHFQLKRSG